MAEEKRKRILSGIQPTGTPTLGNYIGAVRNWARSEERRVGKECRSRWSPYH